MYIQEAQLLPRERAKLGYIIWHLNLPVAAHLDERILFEKACKPLRTELKSLKVTGIAAVSIHCLSLPVNMSLHNFFWDIASFGVCGLSFVYRLDDKVEIKGHRWCQIHNYAGLCVILSDHY